MNEVKAMKMLDWLCVACFGHNIHLIVNAGISEIHKIVAKGRNLVTFFHHSSSAMTLLLEKQALLLPQEHQRFKLLQDVPTRWHATLDMLERITLLTPALHAVATSRRYADLRSKLFTFDEQVLVDEMVALLSPSQTTPELLSSECSYSLYGIASHYKAVTSHSAHRG